MKKAHMLPADPDSEESHLGPLDPETGEPIYDGPSKSQLKRESEALQALGIELAGLSWDRLKKTDMPDALRDALRDAQRITQNGAKRRQAQLIGKLMRNVDITPLQAALDEVKGISAAANARQHRLEKWRESIMANDAVFAELARDFPAADIQQLRQLRRNAIKEAEQNKPPRAYRELFRQLRELVGQQDKVSPEGTAPDHEDTD